MNRKPIFDAVRKMLDRKFTQAEVDALDRAFVVAEGGLPAALAPAAATPQATSGTPASAAPAPLGVRTLGAGGKTLIQKWEGCERRQADGTFKAYPDPGSADGNPWTIGWGSTGPDIKKGVVFTKAQCDARFVTDMQKYVDRVAKTIGSVATTQNQFDALVSFHYNTGAIGTASLTKLHKQGKFDLAKAEFGKWIYNDHKVMQGLVNRRADEARLYAAS